MAKSLQSKYDRFWTKVAASLTLRNKLYRSMLAEFLGTFILMVFGNGSVAQSVLSRETKGGFLSINWSYAMGVAMAIYTTGSVSGAHINPAVSTAMAVFGKLPWSWLPCYVLAQLVGAFLSGAVVYAVYYDALNAFDGGVRQVIGVNGTAGIFATYPQDFLSIGNGMGDQVFATAMLVGMVFAITDERNGRFSDGLQALIIGLVVFAIGLSYGFNCGYAINPARDFGPRLFTYVAGWGQGVFSEPDGKYWFWVPILGPLIGGVLGAAIYKLVIGIHLPKPTQDDSCGCNDGDEEKRDESDDEKDFSEEKPVLTKL